MHEWLNDSVVVPPVDGSGRQSRRINTPYWMLLFLVCAALYGSFLNSPPVFDDGYMFEASTPVQYSQHLSIWHVRWLPYATFAWTQRAFGLQMRWFHLGNLLLHAANVILLMMFLRRLFTHVLKAPATRGLSLTSCAFAGALLFALHPAAVYAVAYLNQRSLLMATFFSLLALLSVLVGISNGRLRYLWLAALGYLAAVFCKEHVVMLPALFVALAILVQPASRIQLRQLVLPAVFCVLIALVAIIQVRAAGVIGHAYQVSGTSLLSRTLGALNGKENPHLLSVMTQGTLFFKYWLLWLVPNPAWMSVDMFTSFATHLTSWEQLVGLAGFLLYGVLAVLLLFRRGGLGLVGFTLLTPWLLFATELSTVRIQEPFVLYRSYLWMALPMGCLPLLLRGIPASRAACYLAAICLALIPLSINRLQTFSHPLLLWDDAVHLAEAGPVQPGSERLYYNRASALMGFKLYALAIKDYSRALQINPNFASAYKNRGIVWHDLGREDRAVADFEKSLALRPTEADVWLDLGLSEEVLGRNQAAQANFVEACQRGSANGCRKDALNTGTFQHDH